MPKVNSLDGLFLEELRDLMDAEKQVLKALPKMAKAASSPQLKEGFAQHHAETEQQMDRLTGVFDELGQKPRGKKCKGMQALIEEGREMADEVKRGPVRDAVLIEAAQKVEHYEIASYGTLRTYANLLGHSEAAQWLGDTLEEEKATDQKLSELAEGMVNPEAAREPGEMGEEAQPAHGARRRKAAQKSSRKTGPNGRGRARARRR